MKIKNRIFIAVLSLFVGAQIYGAQINPEVLAIDRNLTLFYAVESGNREQVQAALDAGADVNWQVTQEAFDRSDGRLAWLDVGNCPLHFAVIQNDLEMVRLLLDSNADANTVEQHGWTSLFGAVGQNNLEMVRLLLDRDADANAADINGQTPLFLAVQKNNLEMVELLLDRGADVNAADRNGSTPLFSVVGQNNMLELLLDRGADVNTVNGYGANPLYYTVFYAVFYKELPMVELLLERGVNPDIIDQEVQRLKALENRTAIQEKILDLLCRYQNSTILK